MIPVKLQIILLIGSMLGFLIILNMIRRYKLDLKYSMLWLLLSLTIIVLAIFYKLPLFISKLLGIETPVNAIFLLGILCLLMIVFSLTVALSRNSNKVRALSQELGIVKQELLEIKLQIENNNLFDTNRRN